MQVKVTYECTENKVYAIDTCYKFKELVATCVDPHAAALVAHSLNFTCRSAAEAVAAADMIFTYANRHMTDHRM